MSGLRAGGTFVHIHHKIEFLTSNFGFMSFNKMSRGAQLLCVCVCVFFFSNK